MQSPKLSIQYNADKILLRIEKTEMIESILKY